MSTHTKFKYNWFSGGDVGASATIIFDNLSLLTFISLILRFGYNFPQHIILKNIIPGTVFGVLVGNLLCLWLSFRLAKKEQRDVTAIPFGLDAPSAIGFAICIVGPAFKLLLNKGLSPDQAGILAWHIGVGCLFCLGLIKLFCSLFAEKMRAVIPQAALLGAIGGVAIGLIAFTSLISIFKVPLVGIFTLGIVLFTIFAKVRLPFNLSGIPVAVVAGTVLYYILIPFGLSGQMPVFTTDISFLLPLPNFGFLDSLNYIIKYIPLVIPFGLLVVFGTMSVAESASCMGDNYKVRDLMLIDSIATLASSLCGGIAQTTPYAGFPAYKKLDARAGFLLINILVVGIGGIFGALSFIVNLVPESAVAPILLFVAFEIAMQGFIQCDKKYVVAIIFSMFPSIARLLQIKLADGSLMDVDKLQLHMLKDVVPTVSDHLAIVVLGNGFIVTGMLWGAMLCFAIDKKWLACAVSCMALAILSYFGIIHSVFITGQMYFPSQLPETIRNFPIELSLGYALCGIMALAVTWREAHVRKKSLVYNTQDKFY